MFNFRDNQFLIFKDSLNRICILRNLYFVHKSINILKKIYYFRFNSRWSRPSYYYYCRALSRVYYFYNNSA